MKTLLLGATSLLLLTLIFPVKASAEDVQEPRYDVTERYGNIEIREYAPMIVFETSVAGEREKAMNQGFRILAGYIFGGNAPQTKIPMTAPVIQQGERIPMTAPVIQQSQPGGRNNGTWRVQFVAPANYTMEDLPVPNDPSVEIKQLPGRTFAAIRFSGTTGNYRMNRHLCKLQAFLKRTGRRAISTPAMAFYNEPWTPPFMRRNEIMVQLPNEGMDVSMR